MKRILPHVVLLLVIAGCSGSDIASPDPPLTTVIRGSFDPPNGDFTVVVDLAQGQAGPVEGPFELRGTNLHYNDLLGALVVDLTVTNTGTQTHAMPVRLAFIVLLPTGVTVMNADEDIDDHPAITFEFTNRDLVWTPGESSVPRTVQFAVEAGTAVGFAAELYVDTPPNGSIGGIVWEDSNADGLLQTWERGLGGVPIHLRTTEDPNDPVWNTRTDSDGLYRFENIPPGTYTVIKVKQFDHPYVPTTPDEIHVLLPPDLGGSSVFFKVDFGCVFSGVENGDFLKLAGYHELSATAQSADAVSPSFVAVLARWIDCTPNGNQCGEPTCPCGDRVIETICGTVTLLDATKIIIMGGFYQIPEDTTGINLDWNAGDRVCVRVMGAPHDPRTIVSIGAYGGADEIVEGVVTDFFPAGDTNFLIVGGVIVCIGRCPPRPE